MSTPVTRFRIRGARAHIGHTSVGRATVNTILFGAPTTSGRLGSKQQSPGVAGVRHPQKVDLKRSAVGSLPFSQSLTGCKHRSVSVGWHL